MGLCELTAADAKEEPDIDSGIRNDDDLER